MSKGKSWKDFFSTSYLSKMIMTGFLQQLERLQLLYRKVLAFTMNDTFLQLWICISKLESASSISTKPMQFGCGWKGQHVFINDKQDDTNKFYILTFLL